MKHTKFMTMTMAEMEQNVMTNELREFKEPMDGRSADPDER